MKTWYAMLSLLALLSATAVSCTGDCNVMCACGTTGPDNCGRCRVCPDVPGEDGAAREHGE
jgi:hypothetical protein